MKWKLGAMSVLRLRTSSKASRRHSRWRCMRYASVTVTLRDTPATQCTSTPHRADIASSATYNCLLHYSCCFKLNFPILSYYTEYVSFAIISVRTDKPYGLREMHGEVLAPVVGDGDLQVVDAAALRLERVWQVWSHVQHVLEFNVTALFKHILA